MCTRFHYLLLLDNDVLETSKRRAMFYNILSQNFTVKYLYIGREKIESRHFW